MKKIFFATFLFASLSFSQESVNQNNIHNTWSIQLQKYVDEKGNVNYSKWLKEGKKELDTYLKNLQSFAPKKNWSKNEILAYWINTYNAFTVQLILNNYPLKSIKDIKNPWGHNIFFNENKNYSLGDIEHKILRKMGEPRIHFAINCASASCPKLNNKPYTADNIEIELERATRDFLNDTNKNEISENKLGLSKIFLWFEEDFGNREEKLQFINKYTKIAISNKAKISYLSYDWSLNE